jgi:tetratricopeptide (TPR) repeat protein
MAANGVNPSVGNNDVDMEDAFSHDSSQTARDSSNVACDVTTFAPMDAQAHSNRVAPNDFGSNGVDATNGGVFRQGPIHTGEKDAPFGPSFPRRAFEDGEIMFAASQASVQMCSNHDAMTPPEMGVQTTPNPTSATPAALPTGFQLGATVRMTSTKADVAGSELAGSVPAESPTTSSNGAGLPGVFHMGAYPAKRAQNIGNGTVASPAKAEHLTTAHLNLAGPAGTWSVASSSDPWAFALQPPAGAPLIPLSESHGAGSFPSFGKEGKFFTSLCELEQKLAQARISEEAKITASSTIKVPPTANIGAPAFTFRSEIQASFPPPAQSSHAPSLGSTSHSAHEDARPSSGNPRMQPSSLDVAARAEALNEQGNLCYKSGRYDDALQAYVAALELEKQARILGNAAACMMQLGDFETALSYCRDAAEMEPENARHWARAGRCAMKMGRWLDCERYFAAALQLEAAEEESESKKSSALEHPSENKATQNQTADARRKRRMQLEVELETARWAPRAEVQSRRAVSSWEAEKKKWIEMACESACKRPTQRYPSPPIGIVGLDDDDDDAWSGFDDDKDAAAAKTASRRSEAKDAFAILSKLCSISPGSSSCALLRIRALLAIGKEAEAVTAARELHSRQPTNTAAIVHLALALYHANGASDPGVDEAEKVITAGNCWLEPGSSDARDANVLLDKMRRMRSEKFRGNKLFKEGQHRLASQVYLDACCKIDPEHRRLVAVLISNKAACSLKLAAAEPAGARKASPSQLHLDGAMAECQLARRLDPKYLKAQMRLVECLFRYVLAASSFYACCPLYLVSFCLPAAFPLSCISLLSWK